VDDLEDAWSVTVNPDTVLVSVTSFDDSAVAVLSWGGYYAFRQAHSVRTFQVSRPFRY
jgi:hypothetical protein